VEVMELTIHIDSNYIEPDEVKYSYHVNENTTWQDIIIYLSEQYHFPCLSTEMWILRSTLEDYILSYTHNIGIVDLNIACKNVFEFLKQSGITTLRFQYFHYSDSWKVELERIYESLLKQELKFYYCRVKPKHYDKAYSYIADEEIDIGDYVEVPFGQYNKVHKGLVVESGYYNFNNAPYPVEKTKHILRTISAESYWEEYSDDFYIGKEKVEYLKSRAKRYCQEKSVESYKKAKADFQLGALLFNDAECFFRLGDLYLQGCDGEKNENYAKVLYYRALNLCHDNDEDNILPYIEYRLAALYASYLYPCEENIGTEKVLQYIYTALLGFYEMKDKGKSVDLEISNLKELRDQVEMLREEGTV